MFLLPTLRTLRLDLASEHFQQQAALGLSAQAQQDEVVAREQGVDHLRDHRVVVADDAGEEFVAALDDAEQVGADFVLDAAFRIPRR